MEKLPIQINHFNGQISCRYVREPSKDEILILAIPGGPFLSGRYLDDFLAKLSDCMKVNVGIIDLPNHGASNIAQNLLPLSYESLSYLVKDALFEIAHKSRGLVFFGQSFGARLAFDLFTTNEERFLGAFLTGFPYKFQVSKELEQKIGYSVEADQFNSTPEENFQRLWKKILPFYTSAAIPDTAFNLLCSDVRVKGNESILNDVPPIELFSKEVIRKGISSKIGILQSDADLVVPNNNFEKLKVLMPEAQYFTINNCGHFPMIENPAATIESFSQFYSSLRIEV